MINRIHRVLALATLLAMSELPCWAASPSQQASSLIHHAAKEGDAIKVMDLIACGANMHSLDQYGFQPLTHAVAGGHTEVVKLLLAGGAIPERPLQDVPDHRHEFMPILVCAAHHKNEKLVRLLLEHGADPNAVHTVMGYGTKYQSTPLHVAAQHGDAATVHLLLDAGANVNCGLWNGEMMAGKPIVKEAGFTPLHAAAQSGHVEIANRLLHRGADIHARTYRGQTPLEVARAHRQTKVAQLLIEHGGEVQGAE